MTNLPFSPEVNLENNGETYGVTLGCPYCKDPIGLHHREVHVYFRKNDRDKTGCAVSVKDGCGLVKYETQGSMKENPSTKRDGIAIRFWCESGCPDSQLNIMQHQGETYLRWDEIKPLFISHPKYIADPDEKPDDFEDLTD